MDACCWICLQEGDLVQACSCPRSVHAKCLAYWQLHSAGTPEEHSCRFCSAPLPDWKEILGAGRQHRQLPVVAVMFGGRQWRLKVAPTPEGARRFQEQIELITGVPFDEQVNIKFFCSPAGEDVSLTGTRCLEAAIQCAAMHCASLHTARTRGSCTQQQQVQALQGSHQMPSAEQQQQPQRLHEQEEGQRQEEQPLQAGPFALQPVVQQNQLVFLQNEHGEGTVAGSSAELSSGCLQGPQCSPTSPAHTQHSQPQAQSMRTGCPDDGTTGQLAQPVRHEGKRRRWGSSSSVSRHRLRDAQSVVVAEQRLQVSGQHSKLAAILRALKAQFIARANWP